MSVHIELSIVGNEDWPNDSLAQSADFAYLQNTASLVQQVRRVQAAGLPALQDGPVKGMSF
jgi:hypothetical protein